MPRKQESAAGSAPESIHSPRFASAWAALVYALSALTLTYPALAGQFLVNPLSDQYKAGYSFRDFAAQTMKATGAFPQWDPYILGGMPYVAAMHGDIFYPTFLLRLILPTDIAMTWGMILHFFLCGLATYWFFRQALRFSFFASLIGGVAYMMGGFVSSLPSAGHDGKIFVSALFPVALLVLTWAMRDGKRWAWGVFAIVVGLTVLTPHPQLLQYVLLVCGAWAVFLAYGGVGTEKLQPKVALERLGFALASVVVGGAIGAIQYLPVRDYVNWSPRAGGWGYENATSYSFPIEELFNTYLPQFSGILGNYWGRNLIHFHSEYIGVAVLMLAAAAFGGGWSGARKRVFWFWTGAGIVSLLWALGGSTPFFHIIYAIVPGTPFFRAPSTIFFVTTFAVAVMAAFGTERLLSGRVSERYAYGWLIGAAAVTLLALTGGLTALAHNLVSPPRPEYLDLLEGRVDAGAADLKVGALRSLLFVALTAAVFILVARKKLVPMIAGVALVALCAVDLWSIERHYWEFSAPAKTLFATDNTIEFLRKLTQPFRTLTLGLSQFPMAQNDANLSFDGLMAHDVRIMLGYHGNSIARWDQFGEEFLNPTTLALTNTEFALANTDTLPLPGAHRVVGPVRDAAGTMVSLFQLPGEHPYAWVTPAIMKYPDSAVAEAIKATNFPVRSVAIFDTSSKSAAVQLTAAPAPLAVTAHVDLYEPGHVSLTLSEPAPKGAGLVVSENFYPGWRATVDGKPAVAERADYTLIGVALPEGAKKVELTFSSDSYEKGKMMTLMALGLSIAALLAGLFMPNPKEQAV